MPRILKTEDGVLKAKAFKENIERVDPTPDTLYFYFGKADAWPNDLSPPTPTDDVQTEFDTRNAMIGMKKLLTSGISFVVTRYNWETGTVYAKYDKDEVDLFNSNFYVLNSDNNVYKCIDNSGGSTSIVEPSGTSTSNIVTGDGYTWKFMYNLTNSMVTNFLTADWLPVPTKDQRTSFQTAVEDAAVYATDAPAEGHGKSAIHELGASALMVTQTLEQSESSTFPIDDDFRQFGLWQNPLLVSDSSVASATLYALNDSSNEIDMESGRILYIDNRRPITRASDQTETFQFIIGF